MYTQIIYRVSYIIDNIDSSFFEMEINPCQSVNVVRTDSNSRHSACIQGGDKRWLPSSIFKIGKVIQTEEKRLKPRTIVENQSLSCKAYFLI